MELYTKTEGGKYVPIKLEETEISSWDNHLVVVRVGNNDYRPSESDLSEICELLNKASVLDQLNNTTFMIVGTDVDFHRIMDLEYMREVAGSTSLKEILKRG